MSVKTHRVAESSVVLHASKKPIESRSLSGDGILMMGPPCALLVVLLIVREAWIRMVIRD